MIVPDLFTPALPDWDDLTTAEHEEHRSACADGCRFCDGWRCWGTCASCGAWPKEASDDGYGCCGSVIILDPADGGPLKIRDAA